MMCAGVSAWQRASSNDTMADNVGTAGNESSFFNEFKGLETTILWVLTIAGLVLDAVCLKWLRVANILFYLELLHTAITAMFPYSNGVA